jgi:hypothetical protein
MTRLVALRRETPALHSRSWELLDIAPADRVLSYRRVAAEGVAVVAVNFSDEAASIELPLPRGVVDLLTGERLPESEPMALPGWGFRIVGTAAP